MLCTYGQAQLLSAFCNDFHIVLLIGSMKKNNNFIKFITIMPGISSILPRLRKLLTLIENVVRKFVFHCFAV